jgi:hypothetical protein
VLSYRYPDHARDVEAMYVAPDATVWLVSKRRERAADRRLRPALLFRLTREAWSGVGDQFAELVDSLPIIPGSAPGRQITDAAIAPDGRYVAVRTYSQVYVFAADSASGRIRTGVPPVTCNIAVLREDQGEAVAWRDPSGPLVLLSEGDHAPLKEARCSASE